MSRTAAETAARPLIEEILLSLIDPSKTNPRKHFNDGSLAELASSIKTHGVASPILLRPHPKNPDRYEIVFGERRFRACKKAGLAAIPAMVRNLDNETVIELQIIENIQREDVHELEEAKGYQELIEHHGYSVASLAEKIKKSQEYVYGRLKLTGLSPENEKLFLSREMTAGHAILLARLPASSQTILAEKHLFETVRDGNETSDEIVSVRRLGALIKEHIHHDLETAIFDRSDPKLLVGAVACEACPKRAGKTCLDPTCFNKKFNAFVKQKVHAGEYVAATMEYNKKLPNLWNLFEAHDRKCPNTKMAILVDGWQRGKTKTVCMDEKCAVHKRNARPHSYSASDQQYREKQRKAKIERAYREALYQAVDKQIDKFVATVKGNPLPIAKIPLAIIASQLVHHIGYQLEEDIFKELGIPTNGNRAQREGRVLEHMKTMTEKDLAAFTMKTALRTEIDNVSATAKDLRAGAENLHTAAAHYRVDVDKLRSQVEAQMQTPAKKTEGKKRK